VTAVPSALKSRSVRFGAGLAGLAFLFWFVPLFHVVSLKATQDQAATAAFDAAQYVTDFWQGPLLASTKDAVDAAVLLSAFAQDFDAAADRYGHRLGLSGTSYYLVRGQGRIAAVDSKAVRISLDSDERAEVEIGTGPVFGNAVRDGSGLLNVSDFANIQDFNAISAEINRRVEEQVLPLLRDRAEVGAEVKFVGGVEVSGTGDAPTALNLVPVVIEFP